MKRDVQTERQNQLSTELDSPEILQLRADLQDMYHYAALITGAAQSTFLGSREYSGLIGHCEAYSNLCERISHYDRPEIVALKPFWQLNLKDVHSIERQAELKREAYRAYQAVIRVARSYECDPYSGEYVKRS